MSCSVFQALSGLVTRTIGLTQIFLLILGSALPASSYAQVIAPGDLVGPDGSSSLLIYDVATDTTDVHFTLGGPTVALEVMPNGDLVINKSTQIRLVDPVSGSTLSTFNDPLLFEIADIAVDNAGQIVVAAPSVDIIVRVPVDGSGLLLNGLPAELLAIGGELESPSEIVVDSSGDIIVLDTQRLIRINPLTGLQTVVSTGGPLVATRDLLVASDDSFVVSKPGTEEIYRISADGAVVELITQGDLLSSDFFIAWDSNGFIVAKVQGLTIERLVRINPATGEQILITFSTTGLVDFNVTERFLVYPDVPFADSDADGIFDAADNCVMTPNATQPDVDGDGVGDACDTCPDTRNPAQADGGGLQSGGPDGIGDLCQRGDINGDGIVDMADEVVLRREFAELGPGFEPAIPPQPEGP